MKKFQIKKPATTSEIRYNFANMDHELQGYVVAYLTHKHAVNASYTASSHFHVSDLESFLSDKAWVYATKYDVQANPNFEAYMKQFFNWATLDFYGSQNDINVTTKQTGNVFDYKTGEVISKEEAISRGLDLDLCDKEYSSKHDVANFSELVSEDAEGGEVDFCDTYVNSQPSTESVVSTSMALADFLATLSDRQRTIVNLKAGILTSLTADELAIAKSILAKQHATKKTGEVYLSNSDIATILGIGRVKVQNHLARIAEKANQFEGLKGLI